jgi:hypothetical protein
MLKVGGLFLGGEREVFHERDVRPPSFLEVA